MISSSPVSSSSASPISIIHLTLLSCNLYHYHHVHRHFHTLISNIVIVVLAFHKLDETKKLFLYLYKTITLYCIGAVEGNEMFEAAGSRLSPLNIRISLRLTISGESKCE